MTAYGIFALFLLSLGVLQVPLWALAAAYASTGSATECVLCEGYNTAIALYLCVWGLALLAFFIFSLRTDALSVAIFGIVTIAAFVLSDGCGGRLPLATMQRRCIYRR